MKDKKQKMDQTPRVTQALIYAELQAIKQTLKEHSTVDVQNFQELRALLEGTPSAPGMRIRVDRLEQSEEAKRRYFQYVWGVMLVVIGAVLKLLFV